MTNQTSKQAIEVFKNRTDHNIKAIEDIVNVLNRVGLDKIAQELDTEIGTIRHNLNTLNLRIPKE